VISWVGTQLWVPPPTGVLPNPGPSLVIPWIFIPIHTEVETVGWSGNEESVLGEAMDYVLDFQTDEQTLDFAILDCLNDAILEYQEALGSVLPMKGMDISTSSRAVSDVCEYDNGFGFCIVPIKEGSEGTSDTQGCCCRLLLDELPVEDWEDGLTELLLQYQIE
jgi:hypothetical protein